MPQANYKEWINGNIRGGLIKCYSEDDIILNTSPIAHGSFGIIFKATLKDSGITVVRKTLFAYKYGCEEKLYKAFVKEVGIGIVLIGTTLSVHN